MHHLFFVLYIRITFYVNMRTHIHFSPGATDADQPTNQQLWPHRFVLLLLLLLICVFHPHPGPKMRVAQKPTVKVDQHKLNSELYVRTQC